MDEISVIDQMLNQEPNPTSDADSQSNQPEQSDDEQQQTESRGINKTQATESLSVVDQVQNQETNDVSDGTDGPIEHVHVQQSNDNQREQSDSSDRTIHEHTALKEDATQEVPEAKRENMNNAPQSDGLHQATNTDISTTNPMDDAQKQETILTADEPNDDNKTQVQTSIDLQQVHTTEIVPDSKSNNTKPQTHIDTSSARNEAETTSTTEPNATDISTTNPMDDAQKQETILTADEPNDDNKTQVQTSIDLQQVHTTEIVPETTHENSKSNNTKPQTHIDTSSARNEAETTSTTEPNATDISIQNKRTHQTVAITIDKDTLKKEKTLFQMNIDYETTKTCDAILVDHPSEPDQSRQVQRIAYLLSQYQTFNSCLYNPLNTCLFVYKLIDNGSVENDGCGAYTIAHLLNDYYYILVHYCNSDTQFLRLYQYISSQLSATSPVCDIEECEFIQRNYLSPSEKKGTADLYDTSSTVPQVQYYGFNDDKQMTCVSILDKIHCHLLHSYDLGFRLDTAEQRRMSFVMDQVEQKHDLVDYHIVEMRRIIRHKRKNLIRIIGKQRHSNNKFVTNVRPGRKTSMFEIGDILTQQSTNSPVPSSSDEDHTYRLGQKFYYWSYHKRAGWKWYVEKRYNDLKEEMIENKLLNTTEFNRYYQKASYMHATFLCKSYEASVEKYFDFYGISDGDALSIHHVLSVLLFMDYSLQTKLNHAFINLEKETDDELRHRHSFYVNWARLLCETVEIFGNYKFHETINDFYHGTNCCMYFDEIYASLYAPTSMSSKFEVIMSYANEDGLVLDLQYHDDDNDRTSHRYFECNWISDWVAENEILFVGSSKLYFKSIIHHSLCHNYTNYITAMHKLEHMLLGHPAQEAITGPVNKALDELMDYKFVKSKAKKMDVKDLFKQSLFAENKVADYVFEFFHHFVQNIDYHIKLDMYITTHDYASYCKHFLNTKQTFVQFDKFCILFKNVRYFSMSAGWSIEKHCGMMLTQKNITHLYHVLGSLNRDCELMNCPDKDSQKYPKIESKLERITIDNPRCHKLSVKQVVNKFGKMFSEIGWIATSNDWKKGNSGNPVLNFAKRQ
eukprot:608473_1